MIRRFFKKVAKKAPEAKKPVKATPISKSSSQESQRAKPIPHKKILTAEGWKRMMMRKSSRSGK